MKPQIIEYQLIDGYNFDSLARSVQAEIKKGWVPFKRPFAVRPESKHGSTEYCQAMVKRGHQESVGGPR